MSKKIDKSIPDQIIVETSAFDIMQDVQKKKDAGERLDEYTVEAMRSVEFASNLMDSLLNGRQLDLAFYKLYTKNAIANLRRIDKRKGVKRTIKSRLEDTND